MKARQKGKQNKKRELEIRYIKEARALIAGYGYRKWIMKEIDV